MAGDQASSVAARRMPNGPGAAAVLAAGVGCFTLGVVSVLADNLPPLARGLSFYRPTGPLSGVSTVSIVVWLASWTVLHYVWRRQDMNLRWTNGIAFLLLLCGVLLTFPPIGDLL